MKKQVELAPQFNSGIAYLERMHNLKISYHRAILDDRLEDAFNICCSLQGELAGRMNSDQIKESIAHKKKTTGYLQVAREHKQFSSVLNSLDLRFLIMDWFTSLCKIGHSLGLEMPDKENVLEATKA